MHFKLIGALISLMFPLASTSYQQILSTLANQCAFENS